MMISMLNTKGTKADQKQSELLFVYVGFAVTAMVVYHWCAEGEFSAVFTLSALFQMFAFALLGAHVLVSGSVHGISAKSLQLEAFALACRMAVTWRIEGYVPNDLSGEYMYQLIDVASFSMVLYVLYQVMNGQDKGYEKEEDRMPIMPFVAVSAVLACLLHAEMMMYIVYDIIWMCGLFVSAVSVIPQLFLMARRKQSTPALASHFIAVTAFGRILSGIYMYYAHTEITGTPWIGNFNHPGWAVVAAHVVHLLLLGDFGFFYVKNLASSGLRAPLDLPGCYIV